MSTPTPMKDNRGFVYIPDWMVRVVIVLLAVGAITVIVGSIGAVVWLVNHVRFI